MNYCLVIVFFLIPALGFPGDGRGNHYNIKISNSGLILAMSFYDSLMLYDVCQDDRVVAEKFPFNTFSWDQEDKILSYKSRLVILPKNSPSSAPGSYYAQLP